MPSSTSSTRIQTLPPEVAIQIAAGEVVTRPASVAKELLENALDAGAGRIRVDVDGGGVGRLAILDDGSGMVREDAIACIERHATSKLRAVDDLATLESFGFRGEALPSIAAVSRLRLQTRVSGSNEGTEVLVEGAGATPVVRPVGCAVGTTVEVTDLFFNVPARRKFLRAASTEGAHVTDVVRGLALAHSHVQLELHRDGRRAKRFLPTEDRGERTREVLDGYPLVDAKGGRHGVDVEAFLSTPDRSRSGAGGLYLFVLGRPVQDRALSRAVAQAYAGSLTPGRYPVGAVFITLPPSEVDINVHPQKSEVRFAQARDVADAVFRVVGDAIGPRFVGERAGAGERQSSAVPSEPRRQSALNWAREPAHRDDEGATGKPETTWRGDAAEPSPSAPDTAAAEVPTVDAQVATAAESARPKQTATPPEPASPKPTDRRPSRSEASSPASQRVHVHRDEPPSSSARSEPRQTDDTPKPERSRLKRRSRVAPAVEATPGGRRWLATEQGMLIIVGPEGLRLVPRKAALERQFLVMAERQLREQRALEAKPLLFPLSLTRSRLVCERVATKEARALAKRWGVVVTSSRATPTITRSTRGSGGSATRWRSHAG